MNDPRNDETIQQLVRAVLDAVDSRLGGIRHELAVFSGDVERHHHEVLDALAAMERRVNALEREAGDRTSTTSAVRDRLEQLQTQLALLEHEAHTTPPQRGEVPALDLSAISMPLYATSHITTQLPAITDPAIHEITSLPIPPAVPPTMSSPTGTPPPARVEPAPRDITEEIDLEQLTNLLNERLGHLNLPPRADD
jgi:hypothetical protein